MSSQARVSVLLPAYNAALTLPACLRSLQRQSERQWHCVLLDDGSGDQTLALARAAARDDPRIEVLARPHLGLVASLNYGLSHCRGEYVARMDADDWMHRERLRAQCDHLDAAPQLSAVGCHVRSFPRRNLSDGWRAYETWLNSMRQPADVRRDAFIESPLAHPTLMMRRTVLQSLGYRDCGWAEDYDLVLRALAAGHQIGVVPRRLLCWRDHPQRLTRTDAAYDLTALTACRAAFLASGPLATTDTYILWGYGGTGRALQRALRQHGKRPAYIVELHPGRLGMRIHGAAVIAPAELANVGRLPLVASVAGLTARSLIRQAVSALGWVEGRDFVCAA